MILKIYAKIKNKWCLSRIVYSDTFMVRKNFIYENSKTVHYSGGFIDAEKIKIYPLFHVAKIWENPRVYNKEI
jgi:hypothetical protein